MGNLDDIILELKKFNQLVEGLRKTRNVKKALENNDQADLKETEKKLDEIIKLSFDASKIGHIGNEATQERVNLTRKINNK